MSSLDQVHEEALSWSARTDPKTREHCKSVYNVLDLPASRSFEIYLVHSMILFRLSFLIHEKTAEAFRSRLLLIGIPVTLIFAYLCLSAAQNDIFQA